MSKSEMIKWLQNLKKDIGQSQHQDLWHYAEMLDEVIDAIEAGEDAISRANAIKAVKDVSENYTKEGDREWHPHIDFIVDALVQVAPSVIPKPKEGEWMPRHHQGVDKLICECSNCHTLHVITNFCPNCGADMRGGKDD